MQWSNVVGIRLVALHFARGRNEIAVWKQYIQNNYIEIYGAVSCKSCCVLNGSKMEIESAIKAGIAISILTENLWYTKCFSFVSLQNSRTIQTQGNLIMELFGRHICLTMRKGWKFCSSSEEPLTKNWFSQWGIHVLLVQKMLSHGMIFTTKPPCMVDLLSK